MTETTMPYLTRERALVWYRLVPRAPRKEGEDDRAWYLRTVNGIVFYTYDGTLVTESPPREEWVKRPIVTHTDNTRGPSQRTPKYMCACCHQPLPYGA